MRTVSVLRPQPSERAPARRGLRQRCRRVTAVQLLAAFGVICTSAVGGLAVGAFRSERHVAHVEVLVSGLADPLAFDPGEALRRAGVDIADLRIGDTDVDEATRLLAFRIEATGADTGTAWKLVDEAGSRYVDSVRSSSRAASAEQLVRSINALQLQLTQARTELVAAEAAWRVELQAMPIADRLDASSPVLEDRRDEVERLTAELSAVRLRSDPRTVDADQPMAELLGPVAAHTDLVGVSPWRGASLAAIAAAVVVGAGLTALNALPQTGHRRTRRPTPNQIGTTHL
ncbi:MAG: hypothetical protein AB7O92_03090 [Acidimicrobiia bacterium]